MKKCRWCGEEKDLSCFSKNKNHKDGLSLYCKACSNEYYKEHYKCTRRALSKNQYAILKLIDSFYKEFGEFPTYEKLSKELSVSRQYIQQCVGTLAKRFNPSEIGSN